MDNIISSFGTFLSEYIPRELIVFIISLMPILELRGGLLYATIAGVPWLTAAPIAILGNIIPVPFIIFFIERILGFLKVHGPIKKLAAKIEEKGRKAGQKLTSKYKSSLFWGLFLFVAIPLPGTGAWTGSLAAALLGMDPKKSAVPICLGVLGACIVVSFFTYVIPTGLGIK